MLLGLKYDHETNTFWGCLPDDTVLRDYDVDTLEVLTKHEMNKRMDAYLDRNPQASHTMDPNLGRDLVDGIWLDRLIKERK